MNQISYCSYKGLTPSLSFKVTEINTILVIVLIKGLRLITIKFISYYIYKNKCNKKRLYL